MPVTRSATRRESTQAAPAVGDGPRARKRKTGTVIEEEGRDVKKKLAKTTKAGVGKGKKASGATTSEAKSTTTTVTPNGIGVSSVAIFVKDVVHSEPIFLPAVLSFSFDDAKQHLITIDPRFEDLFDRVKCRPFEHLECVDPFRTLATSILGQQISWLAARSITHRFIRLFDPSLPEKPPESGTVTFFPSAQQVAAQEIPTLRTAGLSGRKAEYVQDLAARFADGRLSSEKIMNASDEELYEMLIAVRGIGKWTVDMFAIFSLRRPDIMPVGDLGVQRGVVRWFLSLHSPKHDVCISPRKLSDQAAKDADDAKREEEEEGGEEPAESVGAGVFPTPAPERALTPDAGPFPPAPVPSTPKTPVKGRRNGKDTDANAEEKEDPEVPMPPPAFTPSINRTLNKVLPTKYEPPTLPEGLTVRELQSRLEGKKKIKGAILTPKEMEELTEAWKPYRSLGVYYMWALAEGNKS